MSDIGSACTRMMCPSGTDMQNQGTCATGERCIPPDETCGGGWVGGYCSQKCGRDNPGNPGCPGDARCVRLDQGSSSIYRCLKSCASHGDCRLPGAGYVCEATSVGPTCQPGRVCEQAPTTLPRGNWDGNRLVPGATPSTFESEGNAATDGLGHVAISEIGIYRGGSVMAVAVYSEATASFHTPVAYGEYPSTQYTSDPVVAYDVDVPGTVKPLYLVWLNIDLDAQSNPSNTHVMVAQSLDNGVTFGAPNNMATAAVNTLGQEVSGADSSGFIDKPWIAASGGKVYVTYGLFTGAGGERMVWSGDGGRTWSAPRTMNNTSGFHNFGQVAVAGETGDVYVTYTDGNGLFGQRWRRSAAATWFEPEVALPGSGNLVNPSGNAVTRDGSHFWAAWDDGTQRGSNILVSVAANAGAAAPLSFGTPVTVNDNTSCGDHVHATVALDASGRGHVLWLDDRYSGNLLGGVAHYAISNDASGTSFSTPVVVSDVVFPFTSSRIPGIWLGDYVGIAVAGSKVWASWADARGDNLKTHFYLSSRTIP